MENTNQATEGQATEGAAATTAVATPAAKPVNNDIIHGRMPVAVVALARFGNTKDLATKEMANLFGTTVGKIDDIKKNRNFAYVTADYKPSQADKDAGLAWLKRHPKYDAAGTDKLVTELDAWPVASAEEQAAFEKVRTDARGQSPVTKEGETANAGGGNRRAPRAKKEKAPTVESTQATGDALLA